MNKLEKIDIPLTSLIGGAQHALSLFRIQGSSKGPHVHIQSSVHGAEAQGNAVIYRLLEYFLNNEFNGSVTFIPHANPISANTKCGTYTQGRFNSVTGENWNRIYTDIVREPEFNLEKLSEPTPLAFKKFLYDTLSAVLDRENANGICIEKKLGLTLQKVSASADIVLDLHTGPIATRYLYIGEYAAQRAQDFPFPFKLIIPNTFAGAMDEATFIPWIEAGKVLGFEQPHEIPFESYTVELGSEEVIDLEKAREDAQRILILLNKRGVAKNIQALANQETEKKCLLKDYKSYYATETGVIEYLKSPGEKVVKGETLYRIINFNLLQDGMPAEKCLIEVAAQEDSFVINHTPTSNIHEGMMVYQLLTNPIE